MLLTELHQGIWDPLEAINQIRSEMNQIFRDRTGTSSAPALNVWSNENEAVVIAELPGVAAEDIDISVDGNALTLMGSRKWEGGADGNVVHRLEAPAGEFRRTVELPFRVDADRIEARIAQGVLAVRLPRVGNDKPKKIQVKVG